MERHLSSLGDDADDGVGELLRMCSAEHGVELAVDEVDMVIEDGANSPSLPDDVEPVEVEGCDEDGEDWGEFLRAGALKEGDGETDASSEDVGMGTPITSDNVLFERVGVAHDGLADPNVAPPAQYTAPEASLEPVSAEEEGEGIATFEMEVEMIMDMFEGTELKENGKSVRIQVLPESSLEKGKKVRLRDSKGLFICVARLRGYPNRAPEVTIEPWHNLLSRGEVDELYRKLRELCTNSIGAPMLMGIVASAAEIVDKFLETPDDIAIRAGHETGKTNASIKESGIMTRGVTERLAPTLYLGSMGDILGRIPRNYDVIHCENILKEELALKFEKMQRYFYHKYVEPYQKSQGLRGQKFILKRADITPVFHGTRMSSIGRIVRDGLLVPDDKGVRCGSRYGRGIYSTPDPDLALMYAERGYCSMNSVKLMLCAVLKGRVKMIPDGEEPWGGGVTKGYDTHESEDGSQVVVFNEWQMLPCYVIHLQQRTERRERDDSNVEYLEDRVAAEIRRGGGNKRHKILTAMARKNLPFGFGPRGINFVVEEIGYVSEDEEEWGEYQHLRDEVAYEEFQHETMLKARSRK